MFKYDIALSYASEDRSYVEKVAYELQKNNVMVFYDVFEQADLWGKDLYTHLQNVYKELSKYTIIFCSKYYNEKSWCNHERKSAQERAFRENKEYILPVRFDNTLIPGIADTTGYIDLTSTKPDDLVELILKKIGITKKTIIKNNNINFNFKETGLLYEMISFITEMEEALHNLKLLILNESKNGGDYMESVFHLFSPYSRKVNILESHIIEKLPEDFFNNLDEKGIIFYTEILEINHLYTNLWCLFGEFIHCNFEMYKTFTAPYNEKIEFYNNFEKEIDRKIQLASNVKISFIKTIEENR